MDKPAGDVLRGEIVLPESGVCNLPMPREVRIYYGTDWKGESGWRRIVPLSIGFEKSKWRPVQHWVLHAFDVDRGEEGSFAMQDIKKWEVPCNREALATPSLIPKEGTAAGQ